MKTDIHPRYFEAADIRCSCGNVLLIGSTKEHLRTELCSKCHPFYTGQQKLVDTAGRVDKFEARRKAAALHKQAKEEHERAKKLRRAAPAEEERKTKKAVSAKATKAAKKTETIQKKSKMKKK